MLFVWPRHLEERCQLSRFHNLVIHIELPPDKVEKASAKTLPQKLHLMTQQTKCPCDADEKPGRKFGN